MSSTVEQLRGVVEIMRRSGHGWANVMVADIEALLDVAEAAKTCRLMQGIMAEAGMGTLDGLLAGSGVEAPSIERIAAVAERATQDLDAALARLGGDA